jgi:TonB family protein
MSRAPQPESDRIASLLNWQEPVSAFRLGRAAAVSIAIHMLALVAFLLAPETRFRAVKPITVSLARKQAVKLIAPRLPKELTQKAPNEGKVTHELDINTVASNKPAPRSFQVPLPAGPANRAPAAAPNITAPEIDITVEAPQVGTINGTANLPQYERPKLDSVAPKPTAPTENPTFKAPKAVDTAKDLAKAGKAGGGGGGVYSNGDNGDPASVGAMQLLSDPLNIDFAPYMRQVLASVRRQWFAVIPQIARTGRQGIVVLQFSVDRKGQVPKLVIANTSGTVAFDQAAVASVSASNPFPPLPNEYRGNEIRLQLAFSYNVPRAK